MFNQFVSQEFCLRCRGCCRFSQRDSVWSPALLDKEVKAFLKYDLPSSMISKDKKMRLVSFPKQDSWFCPLFDSQDNKCKLYNLRPFECQLYPFLINRDGDKIFLAADSNCPGIDGHLETHKLKKHVQYLTDLLTRAAYKEIFSKNPQIIQSYKNVLNLAELKV